MDAKISILEDLPKAVSELIEQVSEIKLAVDKLLPSQKKVPIGIDLACSLLQKAKPTVYALVRQGKLPCYKSGKKLYFYEEELLEYIEQGRKKNPEQLQEGVKGLFYPQSSTRPTYRDKSNSKK
jgi:excisionase family DNA binding protein